MIAREQLVLALPARSPRRRREDFVVSETNAAALAFAENWLAAPDEWRLAICGPEASGKTHLARIIAETSPAGGIYVTAEALGDTAAPEALAVIDDADRCVDPHRLLAIMEAARERKTKLVLAGAGAPGDWARGLPDLRTRLEAMPRIHLGEPDEELLRAVIQKLFRDRQLRVHPGVAAYAATRLPRTFAAAGAFVEAADRKAAEKQRSITRNLAHDVINALF